MRSDFSIATHTAVISDLHLCEAEPLHPHYPLWKKYKTRQFFFDDTFVEFLAHIQSMARGEQVELVLNGDIFDFDSILSQPEEPIYRISWLEEIRGLHSEEEKSIFKIQRILQDHATWINALSDFIKNGHRVVFVIGNHDLELHWPGVQKAVLESLCLDKVYLNNLRFAEWFYISNNDTLVEHGNQYDPYCVCLDPIHPFVQKDNRIEVRLPFGNIACRYMMNGMAFFNPHVESAYIMTVPEYLHFFTKYMLRAQPVILWTWFWGSFLTLWRSVFDALLPALKDPLRTEDKVEEVAAKSNATPRMVREMKDLMVYSATRSPLIIARELWLDRAFLILIGLLALFQIFLLIKQIFNVSFFWMFIPIFLLVPFFLFYSRAIRSNASKYKEPQERTLALAGMITGCKRIVYGHTHIVRHEIIGAIEHLNSGCWSPAFLDVECTKPIGQKTFVWIHPGESGLREASVYHFTGRESVGIFDRKSGIHKRQFV